MNRSRHDVPWLKVAALVVLGAVLAIVPLFGIERIAGDNWFVLALIGGVGVGGAILAVALNRSDQSDSGEPAENETSPKPPPTGRRAIQRSAPERFWRAAGIAIAATALSIGLLVVIGLLFSP